MQRNPRSGKKNERSTPKIDRGLDHQSLDASCGANYERERAGWLTVCSSGAGARRKIARRDALRTEVLQIGAFGYGCWAMHFKKFVRIFA